MSSSGTLGLNWNIAPTNANTANAIVKRDAAGSFNAGAITAKLGVTGLSAGTAGVTGTNSSGGFGVYGTSSFGPAMWGESTGTSGGADGVHGVAHGPASGVAGINDNASGVGVWGQNTSSGTGIYGTGNIAVFGATSTSTGYGVYGANYDPNGTGVYASGGGTGVYGQGSQIGGSFSGGANSDGAGMGVVAAGGSSYHGGVGGFFAGGFGNGSSGGHGIWAQSGSGRVSGAYAGVFEGDVIIYGNLSKAGGSFQIDHPLDPANKYLYHSFVESPDMKNIYDGEAVLDGKGEAEVELPEWFETLNRDFRYQLTAVGAPGPNLHVAEKVHNNSFKIAGGQPGMEVSWQVTGIRQDAWANAHRIPIEQDKLARERGFYLHPDLYGAPEEKGIEWASHPEMMKRMKERRAKLGATVTIPALAKP